MFYRATIVNQRPLFISLATAFALLAFAHSAAAEESTTSFIGFNDENGMQISEHSTISGFLVSANEPSEAFWSALEQSGEDFVVRGGGTLQFSESHEYGNLLKWSWEATIDPDEIGDCSCILQISISDIAQNTTSSSIAAFIGNSSGSVLLPESPLSESWIVGEVEFSGWSAASYDTTATISFSLLSADSPSTSCANPPASPVEGALSLIGEYSAIVDASGLDDGWYSAWTASSTQLSVAYHCVPVRVDNNAPVSSIIGPDEAQEGDDALLFDGGSSDDGYWGKGDLYHIWTLLDRSNPGSAPILVSQGESTFSLETDISGNFELLLRVKDDGGLYSSVSRYITITNVIPTAKLTVDGKSVSHGESIRLSSGDTWDLDASESLDSTNDINGLRCVWKVNNEPVNEGCQRSFTWPESNIEKLILTIEVIDDDDQYSFISVELIHPDYTDELPLGIIVLVLSAAFLASAILFRRKSTSMGEIPKWQPDEEK
jgi:hypothetical protein